MLYNELAQGDILSGVRWRLACLAYTDILLCSIWAIHRIRQTPVRITCARMLPRGRYGGRGRRGAWHAVLACAAAAATTACTPHPAQESTAQGLGDWERRHHNLHRSTRLAS